MPIGDLAVRMLLEDWLAEHPDHPKRDEYQKLYNDLLAAPTPRYLPGSEVERRRVERMERNRKILELWNHGIRAIEISRQLDVAYSVVHNVVRDAPREQEPPSLRKYPERVEEMVRMRQAGATLQEIADHFAPTSKTRTLSRERVRQIIFSLPRPKILSPEAKERERILSAKRFGRAMRQWLWAAGYRRCAGPCKQWTNEVTGRGRRCRACNALYARERYRNNAEHRRYCREYARSERGRASQRAAHDRWAAKNPDKVKAYRRKTQKEYYAKLKTTPEGRAKLKRIQARQRELARLRYHENKVKNPNAVALGKLGGQKSGAKRMENLSPKTRSEIASKAARARWNKQHKIHPALAKRIDKRLLSRD